MAKKRIEIEIDDKDEWYLSRYFNLKEIKFWGKSELSFENGELVHYRITVNEKPPKEVATTA